MDGRILALISACLFSLGPILLSLGYRKGSPDLAVLMSMVVGLPLLLLLAPLFGGVQVASLSFNTLLLFVAGGMLGPLAGRTLLYNSIERLGSSRAHTIQNTAPLITALAAILVLSERVPPERWLAIGVIVFGLAIVGKGTSNSPSSLKISGVILALLSAVSFGVRPVVYKVGFLQNPDPMTASVVGASAAFVAYLIYLGVGGRFRSLHFDRRSILLFGGAGIVHNLGFLAVNFAFNAGDVSLVYPINASAPLITFGLSYSLLHNVERLAAWDFVGTLGVVAGVIALF